MLERSGGVERRYTRAASCTALLRSCNTMKVNKGSTIGWRTGLVRAGPTRGP